MTVLLGMVILEPPARGKQDVLLMKVLGSHRPLEGKFESPKLGHEILNWTQFACFLVSQSFGWGVVSFVTCELVQGETGWQRGK